MKGHRHFVRDCLQEANMAIIVLQGILADGLLLSNDVKMVALTCLMTSFVSGNSFRVTIRSRKCHWEYFNTVHANLKAVDLQKCKVIPIH